MARLPEPRPAAHGFLVLAALALLVLSGLLLQADSAAMPALARTAHRWGGALLLLLALAHMVRGYLAGEPRGGRWRPWVSGILLLLALLAVGAAGSLLAWGRSRMLPFHAGGALLLLAFALPHALRRDAWREARLPALLVLGLALAGAYPAFRLLEHLGPGAYRWPFWLAERLGAPLAWTLLGISALLLLLAPFFPRPTAPPLAHVKGEACTGCGNCLQDCPYEAIRPQGARVAVDAARCTGCGICVGACPEGALELSGAVSRKVDEALRRSLR